MTGVAVMFCGNRAKIVWEIICVGLVNDSLTSLWRSLCGLGLISCIVSESEWKLDFVPGGVFCLASFLRISF